MIPSALIMQVTGVPATNAAVAPVGNGFVVTAGDLSFILKQIKIAERHSATLTPANPCGTLVGPAADQIPDRLTSYGLRTTDGSCNNLFPGRETFAAADVPFPHLSTPKFRDAEPITASFPVGPPGPTSYKQFNPGNVVVDSQPRIVSNLVVDQTSTNPAAIAAAGFPVRTQGNPGVFPCKTDPDPLANPPVDGVPAGCVPSHHTLFIPNVTTDVGLSPPFNSLFTFFGQFFDHGVDQTVKNQGTVFVPLKADDPLRTLGPDGKANTGDEVPASQAFMVLSRAQVRPGPDGKFNDDPATAVDETADNIPADNTDSPWVDQSQTYTSHSSHQVFLREYSLVNGKPVSTGKFLGGLPAGQTYPGSPDGTDGISTWASVKKQAAEKLGLQLVDRDVTDIPMLATDPYGNFIPGPARGLPQYVTTTGLVEGDIANPVPVPANVEHFNTPFLTDIAHNADPSPVDTNNDGIPDTAPTPDADNTPSADFAAQPAGTYDDEMLDAHFACGDGRCNENIALSMIHQVFHSEHNRLVDDITNTLNDPANASLLAAYQAAHVFNGQDISYGFGGRLFQAARFVTEMEYQHLVFEEFARKMVPAIRPFHVYSPDINPAIEAEFAHAVYRFGHSMLDDDVARTSTKADGSKVENNLKLLNAFLNPPEYFDNKVDPAHPVYTPQEAAGAIAMGSSDQAGNEIDEFVTETLRNNLLGLPLDLPTINMTRARDAGVPRLNEFRRAVFADTQDGQLAPYTSWQDYGQHLKHPESLINYVAAYGTHDSITTATTLEGRRNAARAIVDPRPVQPGPDGVLGTADDIPADVQPADAGDFMFHTGTWANRETGLNDVDLWVGGLGEVTNLFGGLLGSTFNYVFQTQLEKLQDGDRLYYLARTPGMNLRTQLEGNSFSEMIQRNTDGANTLKADAFATADCKFQIGNITPFTAGSPTSSGLPPITSAGAVNDDPTTPDCDENQLLVRSPDGTISYRQRNAIDPSGINGQGVYNGTPAADRVQGGNDNDTFWGGDGNDVVDGQGGDDVTLGGNGNDIITDLDGADTPKGGPGNDAIDGGPGDDIPMGNAGQDFINGGANDNESFAGPGADFVNAGQGADAVFGDGGDDWIEGGSGQDLLQGDHGAPFFDDPAETAPGNDIFVGQVGENDYDTEGGDDIMSQNAAIDRNAGAGGFDWAIHQYDTVGADDDLKINQQLAGLPLPVVVNRDRWQETEADSGSAFDDVMRGDDMERVTGGFGFSGCDALDPAGVARISGLNKLVTTFPSPLQPVFDVSPFGFCPLVGDGGTPGNPGSGNVWAEGNILLGGGGNDVIEGRGNNDIIDGDHALSVAISVRDHTNHTVELGRTDLMENKATSGTFGPGTAGMTLQQAVFAGLVDPGDLESVRQIDIPAANSTPDSARAGDCPAVDPADHMVHPTATTTNCDTAVYSQAPDAYTVTSNADGSVTVTDNAFAAAADLFAKGDGIDTLWNVENLRFCTGNDPVTKNCNAFTDVPVTPASSVTQSSLAFGSSNVGTTSATQQIAVNNTGATTVHVTNVTVTGPDATQFSATAGAGCASIPGGGSCNVGVTFSPTSAGAKTATVTITDTGGTHTVTVTGTGVAVVPGAPTIGAVTRGNASATVNWTAPASDGGSAITGYSVRVVDAATNAQVGVLRPAGAAATSLVVTGLTNGTSYRFQVRADNAIGSGAFSALSAAVTPATTPGAPVIGNAANGANGGAITATARWTPPASNGGSAITGYVVRALRMSGAGAGATVLGTTVSATQPAGARTLSMTLPQTGTYRFTVQAVNAVGPGPQSARSNAVLGR
ncbi:MAG: choice-of-anchor D domain-containing protein [Nocardioidaceae bacterium]|nr:choice-of-anchor D domain-containing protein [Nocardioidaceae bacterium]NUS50986.1 choice-of-anchor D domain-containing protein [Nocardioidaceae bacterium]